MSTPHKRCDQCLAVMINGIYCHEHGCPKAKAALPPCLHCGDEPNDYLLGQFVLQEFDGYCSQYCFEADQREPSFPRRAER